MRVSTESPWIPPSSSQRSWGVLGGAGCVAMIGQSGTNVDSTYTDSSSSDSSRVWERVAVNWRRMSSASCSDCSVRHHPSFSSSGWSGAMGRERLGGGCKAVGFAEEEEDGFGCLSGLWVMTDVAFFFLLGGVGFVWEVVGKLTVESGGCLLEDVLLPFWLGGSWAGGCPPYTSDLARG